VGGGHVRAWVHVSLQIFYLKSDDGGGDVDNVIKVKLLLCPFGL
jgi:hypothetical protein